MKWKGSNNLTPNHCESGLFYGSTASNINGNVIASSGYGNKSSFVNGANTGNCQVSVNRRYKDDASSR